MIGVVLLAIFALAAACLVFALAYEEGDEPAASVRDCFRITRANGSGVDGAPLRVPLHALLD